MAATSEPIHGGLRHVLKRENQRDGRVEDGRGRLGHVATRRFPSPLIEPDVPISGIRLSDWFHREAHGEETLAASVLCAAASSPSPYDTAFSERSGSQSVFTGSSPITFTSPSSKAHQKSGSFPPPALPGFNGRMTLSDSRQCRRLEASLKAATLAPNGSPPITRITLPTCRAHYPGGSSGCSCRLLPRSRGLPQMAGGSAPALSLSRPAQASHALRPAGSLSCPRQPLSRGSNPRGYPHEPLVSYQINRQLSVWNLPPLVMRAFGALCQAQTCYASSF